jgi:hypothetical protein
LVSDLEEHLASVMASSQRTLKDCLSSTSITEEHWFRILKFPLDERIWKEYGFPGMSQLKRSPRLTLYLRSVHPETMKILEERSLPPKPFWFDEVEGY